MDQRNDTVSRWSLQAAEFRRGWRPLVACSVGTGLGLSPIPAYTAGIFATALQKQYGWPRGEILFGIIFVTAALVLLGSSIGRLTDKIGARRVAITSTIGLGIALMLLSTTGSNILTFYAGWVLIALVSLGTLPMTYAKVITGWFEHARGLALGIMLASTGISGAIFPFYLNALIAGPGWRVAYLGLGALPLLIAVPVLLVWLKEAAPREGPTAAVEADGLSVREALRQYRFWAAAIAALCVGAGTGGLMPNLMPLLADNGLTPGAATKVLAVLAISVTIGRLLCGWMLDRLWAPLAGTILIIPATIAAVALTTQPGVVGSTVAVAAIGLIAGAEFDLVAYMTGRYFGRRHFSELYGIQYAIFGLGAGIAPASYGAIRDHLGSYHPVLLISAGLFVASAAILLTLGRYPARFAGAAH
ncbi:MFS transporter [Glacieibacterium megasporae]|uniref:MFS transporter n=1 Tax=Glacieibacterium megasporae TaxID=2835787 RepID=UPI001C1E1F3B|nr:MFS transporter [Polymorphobacter megasporae]UAJ09117.1 MFS transporter [Polymorphobacter megasporae]